MITSNIQLGFLLKRGGGQAVQGGLSCPPHPHFSRHIDILSGGGGASCPGRFILPPAQNFSEIR